MRTKKKKIEINIGFKSRWEIFTLKNRLFGFEFRNLKDLLFPEKMEALYG